MNLQPTDVTLGARRDYSGVSIARYSVPLAVSAWVNIRSLPDGVGYDLNIKGSTTTGTTNTFGLGRVFAFGSPAAGACNMTVFIGGSGTSFNRWTSSGSTFYMNTWVHVVRVMKANFATDGSDATAWLNGVEVAGAASASSSLTLATLSGAAEQFNRAYDSVRRFDGQIEDLAVWALDPNSSQVAEMMSLRTEAQWAASSLANSAALVARVLPSGVWTEYSSGYSSEGLALSPTTTGTVTTVDFGTLASRVPSLRGINRRHRADTGVYTGAGVTAATATGDRIQQWNDTSGNAGHMTQATPGVRPYFLNDSGRNKAVVFDNPLGASYFDVPATTTHVRQNRTLVIIGRFRQINRTYRPAWGNGAGDIGQNTSGMYAGGTTLAIDACDTLATLGWVLGASSLKAKRNLTSVSGSALTAGVASAGYFGRSNSGADYADMEIHEVLDIGEAVSDSLWAEIHSYAQTEWGVKNTNDSVIIVGTSSAVGTASDYCRDLAWLLAPSLPGVRFFNLAVGGEVVADAITNRAAVQGIITRELALTGKRPAILVWEGSNDTYVSGDTPATVSGNIDTLLGYYVGYGASRIGLIPVLPRGTVGSADNTDRVALNALLRGKGRPVAAADQDARLADGAQTSTTYYTSGEASPRTHLNVTGMGIVAGYVLNVVRQLISAGARARSRERGMLMAVR